MTRTREIRGDCIGSRILGKAADWLAAGSREAWIVAPVSRSVHVLYDDRPAQVFGQDAVPGHRALTTHRSPGFELPLDALFQVLD